MGIHPWGRLLFKGNYDNPSFVHFPCKPWNWKGPIVTLVLENIYHIELGTRSFSNVTPLAKFYYFVRSSTIQFTDNLGINSTNQINTNFLLSFSFIIKAIHVFTYFSSKSGINYYDLRFNTSVSGFVIPVLNPD